MNSVIESHLPVDIEGIDLRELLHDLIEQKWLVITIVFISLICGFIYLLNKTPVYKADVLIQVDSKQGTGVLGMLSQQFNMSSSAEDSSIQMALIQSRFILGPVVESLGLNITGMPYQLPIMGKFFPNKEEIHVSQLEVPLAYYNKKLQLVVDKSNHFNLYDEDHHFLLHGNISAFVTNKNHTFALRVDDIQAKPGTKFILVRYSTHSIVEKIVHGLKIIDTGSLGSGATSKTGVLQISLVDTNPYMLVKILNEIAKILQEKNIEKKSLEAAKALEFLKQQVPLIRNDLERADAKLNIYRAKTGKIDIKIQTQDLLRQLAGLDKQIQELHINKVDMYQQYTMDHPYMIAVNNKIAALQKNRNKVQKELAVLPASDQIAINLMREVAVKSDLYLRLLHKIQELQVAKASTVSDVRILSLATFPDTPLSTNSKAVLAGCLLVGFMLATLIVSAKKRFFNTIEDPLWIEKHLNVVNLSIIPFSKQQKRKLAASKNDPRNKYLQLLAAESPYDLSIEALRSLRTSLQIILLSATNNIVSIMGSSPRIGKSFIAANFAYLLAQAGKRVLLIDGDIRRGNLQDYFQVSRVPGLTDVINGSVTFEQAFRKVKHENITFLSTGTIPEYPSELLTNSKLKEIIEIISSQFDLIIIDTAPILAVTDSVLIGALSGTNLLVVGSSKHQAKELEIAMKRITNAGVKIQGSIFNHLKEETKIKGSAGYNYHYAYERTN